MEKISIIGLDLAKQVFQVHAADAQGRCILRKQLKRREVLAFFAKLTRRWKPAARRITGRGDGKAWP